MSKPTIRATHYTSHVPYQLRTQNHFDPIRTTGRLKVAGEVIWEPGKEAEAERAIREMTDDLLSQIRRVIDAIEAR